MKSSVMMLLVAGALAGLSACSKAYDSDPDTNNSAGGNPIAPVGVAEEGQIVCKFGMRKQTFINAAYGSLLDSRVLSGSRQENSTTYVLSFILPKYYGARTYGGDSVYVQYLSGNASDPNAPTTTISSLNPDRRGYCSLTITDDANNKLVGTFNFKAYKTDTAKRVIDSIVATEGSFNLRTR